MLIVPGQHISAPDRITHTAGSTVGQNIFMGEAGVVRNARDACFGFVSVAKCLGFPTPALRGYRNGGRWLSFDAA